MIQFKDELTQEEQKELLKNREDPQAKEALILHNLKLVNWIAMKYKKDNSPGRELDDLFQEGVIGLINAIEDYDQYKGFFSSYAALHIRGAILRAITNESRIIRIPAHMVEQINNYKKVSNKLESRLNRKPTSIEISDKMNVSLDKVNEIEVLFYNYPISLNAIIGGEDNDITLEDTIVDISPSVETITEGSIFIDQFLNEFKDKLQETQYEIIRLYYGLKCPEYTLQEIADKHGLPVKLMRQELLKGLREVRKSKFIKELYEDYIEREVDKNTSFIQGVDYTREGINGNYKSSQVENIVLQRDHLRKKMLKETRSKMVGQKYNK